MSSSSSGLTCSRVEAILDGEGVGGGVGGGGGSSNRHGAFARGGRLIQTLYFKGGAY